MNNLIFLDTETTGLDEGKDHIVELALVAVRLPDFDIVAEMSEVVVPPMWPTVKRNLHQRVTEMHEASGLMAEIDKRHAEAPNDWRARQVELLAQRFVNQHAPKTMDWHTPLCGAGPDFDRRFIRKQMPQLHGLFHYRNFDVRSLTQLQDWVFGLKHQESPHRALADCLKAIADVKSFLGIP